MHQTIENGDAFFPEFRDKFTCIETLEEKLNYYNQFDQKKDIKNETQRSLSMYNSIVKIAYAQDDVDYADVLANSFQENISNAELN